jgi:hypothetical protein
MKDAFQCREKKLYTINANDNVTITSAMMARGRLTVLGSESLFNIKIKAKQNATMIKVRMEAELLIGITSSYDGIA